MTKLNRPLVVRGPYAEELDTVCPMLLLPSGKFRMFSSNGIVGWVDSDTPWGVGGRLTLCKLKNTSQIPTNYWLNAVFRRNTDLVGIFHIERYFNYSINQTHKTMEIGVSYDDGKTWELRGEIISGTDSPQSGTTTGEGDGRAVLIGDTIYLYILRSRDFRTIVARAKLSRCTDPPEWKKFLLSTNDFTSPGVGGDAFSLGFLGTSPAYFSHLGKTGIIGIDPYYWQSTNVPDHQYGPAMKLSFNTDDNPQKFASSSPLMVITEVNWNRPDDSRLYMYPNVVNYSDGSNVISGNQFGLTYIIVPENENFTGRYLVFQDVTLDDKPSRVALSRWRNKKNGVIRTTTAPIIGNYVDYEYIGTVGYVVQSFVANASQQVITESVSMWPGHAEYLVTNTPIPPGYNLVDVLGVVYTAQKEGTIPLYRCWNPTKNHHFLSNSPDADGQGVVEWLLGYVYSD